MYLLHSDKVDALIVARSFFIHEIVRLFALKKVLLVVLLDLVLRQRYLLQYFLQVLILNGHVGVN